jgi:DNA-binding CsgD family transcriptional regulator
LAAALSLDNADLATAERWLAAHDRWLDSIGKVSGRAESQTLRARCHLHAGAWDRARDGAGAALELASTPRQPLALLAAYRLLGEIATQERRLDEAEQHLAESLILADACGAPFERALTLLALAELRVAQGRSAEARTLAGETRAVCETLGARPTLARADALLASIVAVEGRVILPGGLTTREVEVLRLVAQGLTDAEVAERLFLARRTVNTHLTSIYTKLGVNTRVAAARYAVEHGIT